MLNKEFPEPISFIQFLRDIQLPYRLFSLLKMYNSETDTFFIPVCKLGVALYKMFEVSTLSMGEVTYEEYISTTEGLNMLKAKDTHIYETYWERVCHFYTCNDISGTWNWAISQKVWGTYLFRNLRDSLGGCNTPHFSATSQNRGRYTIITVQPNSHKILK